MWDMIVSVPDHCLSFYFVKYILNVRNVFCIAYSIDLNCVKSCIFCQRYGN